MSSYIRQIQTTLKNAGYYKGEIDGIWGEKSKAALRQALAKGQVIKITENISLNELLASRTATARKIDNMPSHKVLQNLIDSAVNLWQPVRDILGVPIKITSGYRCPPLNRAVNGAANSSHMSGYAIDFIAPSFGAPKTIVPYIVNKLKEKGIKFDQAIIERPSKPNSWVHLAWKHPSGRQRGSSFTIA